MLKRGPTFRVRRVDEARTVIRGSSRAHGVLIVLGSAGMSGLLLLPFGCGTLAGLAATFLCAIVGAGCGYRATVRPEGIVLWRTWFGVPLPGSRARASLGSPICLDLDDDADTFAGVTIAERTLPLPARDRAALKEALQVAVERAVSWSVARRRGHPYRT